MSNKPRFGEWRKRVWLFSISSLKCKIKLFVLPSQENNEGGFLNSDFFGWLKRTLMFVKGKVISCYYPSSDDLYQLAPRSRKDIKNQYLKMSKKISCDLCPKTFASSGSLLNHKKTHSGVKYTCPQCDKSFSQNNSLKRHSLIHSGEKLHNCTQCNFSCNTAGNLKRHNKRHTEEKLHRCNQCEYETIEPST